MQDYLDCALQSYDLAKIRTGSDLITIDYETKHEIASTDEGSNTLTRYGYLSLAQFRVCCESQ